jgi:ferredoxin
MNISIIYFSGTGNTKLVSQLLRNEFQECGKTDMIPVEGIISGRVGLEFLKEDFLLGIGFPIYDLSVPGIIDRLLLALPEAKNPLPVFIFSTMAFIKGDCHNILARALRNKGYYTIAKTGFRCPSNGIAIYERPDHKRHRNVRFEEGIGERIKHFARDTVESFERFKGKPFHVGGAVLPLFDLARYASERLYGDRYYKNLKVGSLCTQCGICVNKCPENNLKLENGRIKVIRDNHCLRCLRCVSLCPQKAINFTSSPRYGDYGKVLMERLYKEANSKISA